MLEMLTNDPAAFIDLALYRVPAVLIALVLHEFAHAYAAFKLGDMTARDHGRLTLNPLAHLDLMGTLLMVFAGFGWAKPVPIDLSHSQHPDRDDIIVSVAGVAVNFTLFIIITFALIQVDARLWEKFVYEESTTFERLSYNGNILMPIMYGYADVFDRFYVNPSLVPVMRFLGHFSLINLSLALFNILPIPPLDGSHIITDILMKNASYQLRRIVMGAGSAALLILSFTGVLGRVIGWAADAVQSGLLKMVGL
ncbi:zinc metalloprotease [Clostridia bacterium]|nr:zinc metalloprotease [Clostridia bacterium]